jgi:hypothetical protein
LQARDGLTLTGAGTKANPFVLSLSADDEPDVMTVDHPTAGALDLSGAHGGAVVEVLLGANATSVVLPASARGRLDLFVKQTGAGGGITWPTEVKWPNGHAPTLSNQVNKGDWLSLRQVAGYWIGVSLGSKIG